MGISLYLKIEILVQTLRLESLMANNQYKYSYFPSSVRLTTGLALKEFLLRKNLFPKSKHTHGT